MVIMAAATIKTKPTSWINPFAILVWFCLSFRLYLNLISFSIYLALFLCLNEESKILISIINRQKARGDLTMPDECSGQINIGKRMKKGGEANKG